MTLTAPGSTVRYTTDFSLPTEASPAYTSPISVTTTTIIRAGAFAAGCLPSPVVTHSYLYKQKVLGNANPGTAPTDHQQKPVGWSDATSEPPKLIDYAMDPVVIRDNKTALVSQLTAIPTVSIVLKRQDFFEKTTGGIYANSGHTAVDANDPLGKNWKRHASIEYFGATPGTRDQENCELSIAGASSISQFTSPKHSLKAEFTRDTASNIAGVMNFATAPFPGSSLQQAKVLMFRNPSQDSWTSFRQLIATYVKEAWARSTHLAMAPTTNLIAHRRWANLYVDGLYWGVYEMSERINEEMMRAYDAATGQWDVLTQSGPENGNTITYNWLSYRAEQAALDPTNADKWTALTNLIDLNNFIDYLLVNLFAFNDDWPGNNWRAARRKDADIGSGPTIILSPTHKFRFLIWDAERAMTPGVTSGEPVNFNAGPAAFHFLLLAHPNYKAAWKARTAIHFGTPGVFSLNAGVHGAATRFQTEANLFDAVTILESARWGDVNRTTALLRADWLSDVNDVKNTWLPARRTWMIEYLKHPDRGLMD